VVFDNFEYKSGIMNITTRISRWRHSYPSFILLIARIILGIILIAKGIFFISHAQHLKELILNSRFSGWVGFLTAYVTFAHLFGGVFIIIGLFTRLAALIQIPVLLGALFFILPAHEVNDMGSDLILSLIVLGLLIYILKKGSGSISMDDYLKHHLL
jgi:putative oxidoreductase